MKKKDKREELASGFYNIPFAAELIEEGTWVPQAATSNQRATDCQKLVKIQNSKLGKCERFWPT
jgi:hypothetical protein